MLCRCAAVGGWVLMRTLGSGCAGVGYRVRVHTGLGWGGCVAARGCAVMLGRMYSCAWGGGGASVQLCRCTVVQGGC